VVEISTPPIKSKKRQVAAPSLSPEIEPPSPNFSPRKRRKPTANVPVHSDLAGTVST